MKYILLIGIVVIISALSVVFYVNNRMTAPSFPPITNNSMDLTNSGGSTPTTPIPITPPAPVVKPTPVLTQEFPQNPKVIVSQLEYPGDFNDDRVLAGYGHNIFVGRVVELSGNKQQYSRPETQFKVEVLYNIKGNLQGTVTVNQEGGYKNGILYVSAGDVMGPNNRYGNGYLLQPGSTYLLSTRYSSTENWYHLNPFPTASKLISGDGSLTTTQLRGLAESDSRVKQLQAAYPREILIDADISHNNTRNSYQSLTEAQKAALPFYRGSAATINPPATTTPITSDQ